MRTLPFAIAVALVAALGCRSNNTQVLVEQEARMLEDEVYNLEAQLDRCCREREALARELADLKGAGGGAAPSSSYSAPPPVDVPPPRSRTRPEMPSLEPPTIELPEASDTPPASLLPGDEQPAVPPMGALGNGEVAQLAINKRLTGGLDRDGSAGDEGIMVMIEPRDSDGRLVKTAGAVSVVVMDPTQTGEAARIARWDFQTHEFAEHFKSSTFGQGLQYELNWPGSPPANRELVLFVRYIGSDGKKLTADSPLSVRLASDPRPEQNLSTAESRGQERGLQSRLVTPDEGPPRELAPQADPPSRAQRTPISPRQARDDRPAWKPYR